MYVIAFFLVFHPFIHELSHAGSYEDGVKSHQLSSGWGPVVVVVGCSAGIPHFFLCLLLAEGGGRETSLKRSVLRLGCESKNENTSTQSRGNQLRKEEKLSPVALC